MDDPGRGPGDRDDGGGERAFAIGSLDDPPGYVTTDDPPGGGGRTTAWLVASVVVVALLAGTTVFAFARERGSNGPDGGGTSEQGYAAPWDGKASMRLPVTVIPNRDLVDGQEVTVTASGFPPNADLGVIMCTSEAAFAGIDACDINTALSSLKGFPVRSDAQGNVSTPYRVSTRISVPAGDPRTPGGATAPTTIIRDDGSITVGATVPAPSTIDCTTGDIDPDTWPAVIPVDPMADPGGFTCIVAVGMVSDYDRSGGAAVGFEGATFRTVETPVTTTPVTEPGETPATPAPGGPDASTPADPAPGSRTPGAPLTTVSPPPSSQPPITSPPGPTTTSPDLAPPPPIDPNLTTTTGPP